MPLLLNSNGIQGNIVIDGNSTTLGIDISNTKYYYDSCAIINADATVVNNVFSGIKDSITNDMVQLYGCITKFSNNTFVRGGQNIRSYMNDISVLISVTPYYHIITNNIFDSPTVDGTNETLINNFTAETVYQFNKNQTDYLAVPLSKYAGYQLSSTASYSMEPISLTGNETIYEAITAAGGTGEGVTLNYLIDLGTLLPTGAQIINAALGWSFVFLSGINTSGPTSSWKFYMYASVPQKYDLASLPYSYIDVYNTALLGHNYGNINLGASNTITVSSSSDLTAISNQTNYHTLDLSATPAFQTQHNKIYALVVFDMVTTPSGSVQIMTSPFVVKFRY